MIEHDHRLPKLAEGEEPPRTPADIQAARVRNCPICSKHNHLTVDPFGFDRDGQAVPGWWFNCPDCGTSESQIHVVRWTKAGIEWMRDFPEFAAPRQSTPVIGRSAELTEAPREGQ